MIAIIDYNMGNVYSVANALESLGQKTRITNDTTDLKNASALVLPGVGAFGDGMKNLAEHNLIDTLNEEVIVKGKNILCICLGLHLIAKESLEFGHHIGLGWINGVVKKIDTKNSNFKIPHMGWNDVQVIKKDPLFVGMSDAPVFYFVHSYCIEICDEYSDIESSTCFHGVTFTSSIQHKNIYAVQFHPEKSQQDGMKLLENYIKLT